MVVQDQAEMGEDQQIPLIPHHTPTFIQPSTSQPQKKQKPRKPKKKDTQIPQSSVPSDNVVDEAVYKELNDSLVRAATTDSSLEAEHDKCGSPRRQETIGDTIAQTRFKNVTKLSNDPLLARGNTLRSGEDSLKLNELMELCTNLQQRVLDLETTKTTQSNEIASLKRRGRRIHDIDADEYITLVNDQDDADMFNVNTLTGDELDGAANTKVSPATTTTTNLIPTPGKEMSIQTRLRLMLIISWLKNYKLKNKSCSQLKKATLFKELLEQRRKHFAAKRAEEKWNKPPTQAHQRKIMCTYLENMEGKKPKDLKNKSDVRSS
ncbi:hypothetical protein Tco_0561073 [Tanacetum coccineum]